MGVTFIIYEPGARGIWRNTTRRNIITEDILYIIPKIKSFQVENINLPYTFVNTMFYFLLTQVFVTFFRITYRLEY